MAALKHAYNGKCFDKCIELVLAMPSLAQMEPPRSRAGAGAGAGAGGGARGAQQQQRDGCSLHNLARKAAKEHVIEYRKHGNQTKLLTSLSYLEHTEAVHFLRERGNLDSVLEMLLVRVGKRHDAANVASKTRRFEDASLLILDNTTVRPSPPAYSDLYYA